MSEKLKIYMEKLDDLPPFICKNAQEIREIDEKVEEMSREIQRRLVLHVKNLKKLTNEQRTKLYKETQALFKEVDKLSDKKVKLAQKMYDTVDVHIKEMDEEIATFHEYQRKKYEEAQAANAASSEDTQKKGAKPSLKHDKRKKQQNSDTAGNEFASGFKPSVVVPVDMPVDPNEPTYCICHQARVQSARSYSLLKVSFGQMVACDGPRCKNEWFHFQCVGLTSSPIGKWYCDDCKETRKKKNK